MIDIGMFCWNELVTDKFEACQRFYTEVFGWSGEPTPMGPTQTLYTMFKKGDRRVAGMLKMDEQWAGVKPHWMAYVSVADCDAAAARVSELGGKVCVPPTDIPPVGRFAVVEDPGGAVFSIIKLSPIPKG